MPNVTQVLRVDKGGDDSTCDGSFDLPCLTIAHAQALIVDAAPAKRYQVLVGPGTYAEDVVLKANVFLTGAALVLTRIQSLSLNDTTWEVNQDSRSGIQTLQVLGTTTLDFVLVQSAQGKMYIMQSRFSGDLLYTACSSVNQVLMYNCELQSNLFQRGGALGWYSNTIFGDVQVQDQDGALCTLLPQAVTTTFSGSGGGNMPSGSAPTFTVLNNVVSIYNHPIQVQLAGFAVTGALVITGDGVSTTNTYVYASSTGVAALALTSISGGANLVLVDEANGVGYTPLNLTAWNGISPVSVQSALDRLAAKAGVVG